MNYAVVSVIPSLAGRGKSKREGVKVIVTAPDLPDKPTDSPFSVVHESKLIATSDDDNALTLLNAVRYAMATAAEVDYQIEQLGTVRSQVPSDNGHITQADATAEEQRLGEAPPADPPGASSN